MKKLALYVNLIITLCCKHMLKQQRNLSMTLGHSMSEFSVALPRSPARVSAC